MRNTSELIEVEIYSIFYIDKFEIILKMSYDSRVAACLKAPKENELIALIV